MMISGQVQGYVVEYGTSTEGISEPFSSIQSSEVVFTQNRLLSEATIAAIPAYTHTGSALTPTLNIDYKGTSLVSGSDYTATFTNNTSTGTASVTITGTGSYTGTISTTFQIVELIPPSDVDISANKNNYSIASLAGTYSLTGYDDSTDYRVYVHIISDTTTATFNITTTSGLTPINGYSQVF